MALIGIAGAHRTGKSTMAKMLVDDGAFFIETRVSDVLAQHGLRASELPSMSPDDFLQAQYLILDHLMLLTQRYSADKSRLYVMDRTPLDALAYFRSYFNSNLYTAIHTLDDTKVKGLVQTSINNYRKVCYELMKYFDLTVIVQPGIKIEADDTKAIPEALYIEHLNVLMKGDADSINELSYGKKRIIAMPSSIISLNDRRAFLREKIAYILSNNDEKCTTLQTQSLN